jgi:hypothetical protein
MPKIFISYRRQDSADVTGRLHDCLDAQFGRESVFMDIDSIPFSVDFRKRLNDSVQQTDVLLAVIGDHWLDASFEKGPKTGKRRLEDPDDYVRIEIESALSLGIPVVPVLVGRASMPSEADLPGSLRELAFRHGLQLRLGSSFNHDVDRLILGIKEIIRHKQEVSGLPRASDVAADVPSPRQERAGTTHGSSVDARRALAIEPPKRVFVSHSSQDRQFVEREIIEPLRKHGLQTWYSTDDIDTATQWESEIQEGLESCDWFLVALSPHSIRSRWVKAQKYISRSMYNVICQTIRLSLTENEGFAD